MPFSSPPPSDSVRRLRHGFHSLSYRLTFTRRKSIECRVKADCVQVFAPIRTPISVIERFLADRIQWIEENQKRLAVHEAQAKEANRLTDGQQMLIDGQVMIIRLKPEGKSSVRAEGNQLTVGGSAPEETLRKYLISLAGRRLQQLTDYYAPMVGKSPGRIAIREQKTKWGSCSSLGNLNFNWKLIMKPTAAMEYVVVHELCHLVHLNHSPDFWALVQSILPDYKARREMLK